MYGRTLLFALLGLLFALALLDYAGLSHFLYWKFWWYDLAAHFLGGVCAAIGAAWLLSLKGKTPNVLFCVGIALVAGGLWEAFEWSFKIAFLPFNLADTVIDLFVDVLGGVTGTYYARFIERT